MKGDTCYSLKGDTYNNLKSQSLIFYIDWKHFSQLYCRKVIIIVYYISGIKKIMYYIRMLIQLNPLLYDWPNAGQPTTGILLTDQMDFLWVTDQFSLRPVRTIMVVFTGKDVIIMMWFCFLSFLICSHHVRSFSPRVWRAIYWYGIIGICG